MLPPHVLEHLQRLRALSHGRGPDRRLLLRQPVPPLVDGLAQLRHGRVRGADARLAADEHGNEGRPHFDAHPHHRGHRVRPFATRAARHDVRWGLFPHDAHGLCLAHPPAHRLCALHQAAPRRRADLREHAIPFHDLLLDDVFARRWRRRCENAALPLPAVLPLVPPAGRRDVRMSAQRPPTLVRRHHGPRVLLHLCFSRGHQELFRRRRLQQAQGAARPLRKRRRLHPLKGPPRRARGQGRPHQSRRALLPHRRPQHPRGQRDRRRRRRRRALRRRGKGLTPRADEHPC
mmetsp:Transcript_6656/g.23547  ORF Transcript_6656/g.23547 Transcript_6656/m.23547 type:complete len:290 (-) Transcript_6656:43-912(-)